MLTSSAEDEHELETWEALETKEVDVDGSTTLAMSASRNQRDAQADQDESQHLFTSPAQHYATAEESHSPGRKREERDSTGEDDRMIADEAESKEEETDAKAVHKSTVKKLDRILLPFLALLFLLNSLDKSNVGNAETAGFTRDVGLTQRDLNISMAYFFFVFVLLQPVGAALGRTFGMRRYVPTCMTLWGLSTLGHIFVRARWQLIVLRVAIAALESGFYPTAVSYLSLFYTKYEFAWRLGLFYGMSAVSGGLGGILSWAVFSTWPGQDPGSQPPELAPPEDGIGFTAVDSHAWKSWQILFLVEGCTTMVFASIGFMWLPSSPGTAWFLNRQERNCAETRIANQPTENEDLASSQQSSNRSTRSQTNIQQEAVAAHQPNDAGVDDVEDNQGLLLNAEGRPVSKAASIYNNTEKGLTRHDVISAFLNYKIWHLLVVNILSAIPATAFGILLPIVVKQMSPALHLSPAESNLLSAPPFACGAIVLFAFTAWSDRSRRRLVPILWGLALLLLGLLINILASENNYWLRYAGLCVLLSGSYIASPLTVAWLANNTPEPGKRAILLGINGWGNLAGVFVAVLFTPEERSRGYLRSFFILLDCVLAAYAGFAIFYILLVRENRVRDELTATWTEDDKDREEFFGDVKLPVTSMSRALERLRIPALLHKLGLQRERMGDEKMTYRYSL